MKKILFSMLESIPLTIFLVYIHTVSIAVRSEWLLPYLLSSLSGCFIMAYLLMRGTILNRLLVGINLYFVSGLFGLLIHWDWLNDWYGQTRAAGMIYWIILVGFLTALISRNGFLGVSHYASYSANFYSALLILSSFVALGLASYFSHSLFLGEWLPFIFLFSLRALLLRFSRMP